MKKLISSGIRYTVDGKYIEVDWPCGHSQKIQKHKLVERLKRDLPLICSTCLKKYVNEGKRLAAIKEVKDAVKKAGGRVIEAPEKASGIFKILGSCGHEFTISKYGLFGRSPLTTLCPSCHASQAQPKKLNADDLKKRLKDIGIQLVAIRGDKFILEMQCGHIVKHTTSGVKKRLSSGRNLCRSCSTRSSDIEKKHILMIESTGANFIDRISSDRYKLKCACGNVFEAEMANISKAIKKQEDMLCHKCAHKRRVRKKGTSKDEEAILDILRKAGEEAIPSYCPEPPNGLECDIFIPSMNTGIECDGVFHHSELRGRGRKYHINKKEYFHALGVNVMFFYDNEIRTKTNIVESMILHAIGKTRHRVFARKCDIVKLSAKEAKDFFDSNHIYGGTGSTHASYGLKYNNEVVSAASFKLINAKENQYELYRFSNKVYCSVPGGLSRLISAFRSAVSPSLIKTFMDLRFSSLDPHRSSYTKVGFEYIGNSEPNYKYFKDSRFLYSRQKFQKHKLKSLLEVYDNSLSEWENMKNNGWNRVWDCGNAVFVIDFRRQ